MVRLARQLDPNIPRAHPLADDDGKITFLVELEPGDDPLALGLREIAPGIARGRLDPSELYWFSDELPSRRLSIAPKLRPTLDFGKPRSGVPELVEKASVDGKGTGKGVVVGVVDTGIDITHPAFRDEDGKTRIAWLLTWGPPKGRHPELEEQFGCKDDPDNPCA